MNILYYLHQFPAIGGIETVTATLANGLHTHGYHVTILSHCSQDSGGSAVRLEKGVRFFKMPDGQLVSSNNRVYLKTIVSEEKIECIVFQDSYAPIEGNLAGVNVPIIVCEHNSPYNNLLVEPIGGSVFQRVARCIRHPFRLTRMRHQERNRRIRLYESCAAYVLLSDRFFGEFRAVTGLRDYRKLRAIGNPLSPKQQGAQTAKKNQVLFCATLDIRKGCDLLLAAWRQIAGQFHDWELVIVGGGREYNRLRQLSSDMPNVRFEGYQPDTARYFAEAKILAFPSRREGWGLTLIEAMANGCVPVAFEGYSALRDIVSDRVNGLIVPPFDVNAFTHSLSCLMSDSELLGKMQCSATRSVERFAVHQILARWISLLKEVV